jgi:hypothetical protein
MPSEHDVNHQSRPDGKAVHADGKTVQRLATHPPAAIAKPQPSRFAWVGDVMGIVREYPGVTTTCTIAVLVVLFVTIDEIVRDLATTSPTTVLRSAARWFWSTSDGQLTAIGLILGTISFIAWNFSNRAEATPNADQMEEMKHFVTGHFASYVARGLAVEGVSPDEVSVAHDRAWRKIYLQHLKLHNELYSFRRGIALEVFEANINEAVQKNLIAIQSAGVHADPTLLAAESSA